MQDLAPTATQQGMLVRDKCMWQDSVTLQGPMSHWQVSMVTQAFNRHDSSGSGLENMTCKPITPFTQHVASAGLLGIPVQHIGTRHTVLGV